MNNEIQKVDLSIHLLDQRKLAEQMVTDGQRMIYEGEAIIKLIKGIKDEFYISTK